MITDTCPTKQQDPHEASRKTKPNILTLQEFCVKVWVLQQDNKQSKLDPKSRQFIFTGIAEGTKGYRYYNSANKTIQISRNVIFPTPEPTVTTTETTTGTPNRLEEEQADSVNPNLEAPEQEEPPEQDTDGPNSKKAGSKIPVSIIPRQPSACLADQSPINYRALNNPSTRGPKEWHHHVPVTEDSAQVGDNYAMIGESIEDEPKTLREAERRLDWGKWKEVMDEEIKQLEGLGTYKLVNQPKDQKPIACKWVYCIKHDATSNIVRYKARLVAKGFSQIPGIDFFKTFALVMRLDMLCLLLALAAKKGMVAHVVDVVGAYLNGHLKEDHNHNDDNNNNTTTMTITTTTTTTMTMTMTMTMTTTTMMVAAAVVRAMMTTTTLTIMPVLL